MKAICCSGRCATSAEGHSRARRWRWALAGLLAPLLAVAAEAPLPLPPEAEAAYQDLNADTREPVALDEAVFTEISPVTVPELGVRMPEDQEL
ncbi:MAG: hypothetical protein AB7I04_06845 [Pseudomonadales bacterium]